MKNLKNFKKNKKGFTLIEIIVVLVIMGILLAIAVPSILGYVGKANDAKYLAEARGGYLAAQTITANAAAKSATTPPTLAADDLNKELGIAETADGGVTASYCVLTTDNKNVKECNITVNGMDGKYVKFTKEEATVISGTVVDGTSATPAK